jgi:hypothetical protein
MNIDNEIIKNLSIYLELKARDGDPDMSEKYRGFISSIFYKIKVKLIFLTN